MNGFAILLASILLGIWALFWHTSTKVYGTAPGGEKMAFGLYWMAKTHWDARSPRCVKRLIALRALLGEGKSIVALTRLEATWRTHIGMALPWCAILAVFDPRLGALSLAATSLLYVNVDYALQRKVRVRQESIERDLPQVLTKIILLLRAGTIAQEAIAQAGRTGTGPLYEEIQRTVRMMENGISVQSAYLELAKRVPMKAVARLCTFVIQNQARGTGELLHSLMRLKEEVFLERKKRITISMQQVPQKLLLPSAMLFIGILAIILIPILLGLSA